MILWAVRPNLEAMLNPASEDARETNTTTWERYQKVRGSYLVSESLRLVSGALHRAEAYAGLRYTVDQDGHPETCDLDGIVLFDKTAFLIEGKAGQFRGAARRGAPKGMIADLKKLVAEPHEQALRARRYINENPGPTFETSEGGQLAFDKARYVTTVLITVSLEPLDSFVATLHQVKDLGIFAEGDLPWAVHLLDLRVVCELIEFPSQFVHYLQRRLRLNELKEVVAHDELDWLGNYLRQGLYFDKFLVDKKPDRLSVGSHTTEIDSYYMYLAGGRKTPASKPRQPMPDGFRHLLEELEENNGEGYVAVAMSLLELGGRERKLLAKHMVRCREQSKRDRKVHDFSLDFDRFGLTVMSSVGLSKEEFEFRLRTWTQVKKYRSKRECWVTVGTNADLPGLIHGWVAVEGSWVEDREMEKVSDLLLPLRQRAP
jgi:hypothetical protein